MIRRLLAQAELATTCPKHWPIRPSRFGGFHYCATMRHNRNTFRAVLRIPLFGFSLQLRICLWPRPHPRSIFSPGRSCRPISPARGTRARAGIVPAGDLRNAIRTCAGPRTVCLARLRRDCATCSGDRSPRSARSLEQRGPPRAGAADEGTGQQLGGLRMPSPPQITSAPRRGLTESRRGRFYCLVSSVAYLLACRQGSMRLFPTTESRSYAPTLRGLACPLRLHVALGSYLPPGVSRDQANTSTL